MNEHCKHDMLAGYCGFCRLPSSDAERAAQSNGHDVVAWLGRFAPLTTQTRRAVPSEASDRLRITPKS
jgi:hypothetical protein